MACLEQFLCTIDPDHKGQWGPKKVSRLANMLGVKRKQAMTVAEVFNPQCFGKRAPKWNLVPGKAFDLELGFNILDEGVRRTIRQYISTQKPGLVCVAPPCTLMSIMQNMSQHHRDQDPEKQRQFNKRLAEAKLLLAFGIEICEMVRSYGGIFLFEHPWTSKAWTDHHLTSLLNGPDILLAKCDQCMYGLKSVEGGPQRKPTGWMTNHPKMAEMLNQSCDHSHEHTPILGSSQGIARSAYAAKYPTKLIDKILRCYSSIISQDAHQLDLLSSDRLISECLHVDAWWQQLVADVSLMEHDVLAASNAADDEEAPLPWPDDQHEHSDPGDQEPVDQQAQGPGAPQGDDGRALPLQRSPGLEQLVRRAHSGLGHVGNERLASILKHAGASPDAVKVAKQLVCSICLQHKRVDGAKKAAPPRLLQPNQAVGIDAVWLPGLEPNGKLKMALNCICWSTRFQLMIPLQSHTPAAACQAFYLKHQKPLKIVGE